MSPIRVDLTMRLARDLGVLDQLEVVPAPFADDGQISTVHDEGLIDAVTRAGKDPHSIEVDDHGLATDDNPVFVDMHRAAAHVVGASLEAFRQVYSGDSLHSANIASKLVRHIGRANAYGQILLGLDRPAADVSRGSSAHDILGVAAILGVQSVAYKVLYAENDYKLPGD